MNTFEENILRVMNGDTIVGAAFLVSDRLVATCAHVVESAGAQVGGKISLRSSGGNKVDAIVEPSFWRDANAEDISILILDEPLENIQPAILGSSSGTRRHNFSTFGFPNQGQELAGGGEIIGQATVDGVKVLQLRSPEVTPGFSGAPIFDETTKHVVGMIVAIMPPDEYQRLGTTAFALRSEVIHEICPEINIDRTEKPSIDNIRFFVTLHDYLNRHTSEFPKEKDFDNHLVFFPQSYLDKMNTLLENERICLLVGNPAAGKTVLAIAFAKMLQEERDFRVYYSNVGRALDGDGRRWFSIIANNDTENTLYIFDNCHLSLDEVNDFSFQLDGNPPKFAWIILIARTGTKAKQADTVIGDFYSLFSESKIVIKPENIYMGILEQYANYYCKLNAPFYVPLELDTKSILERDHSHSLVLSKSRLNTWYKVGGKLSEVDDEAVYNTLADTYLTKAKSAMIRLCSLWQLEIPLHATYVEKVFSQDEIQYLISVNLVTYEVFSKYGKMYYPLLHSEEAKAIFEASITLKWGSHNKLLFSREITSLLSEYLTSQPQNYQAVYDQLYRHGYKEIEQQLLSDENLQQAAVVCFFSGRLTDVARYLFGLAKNQREKAQQLLEKFVHEYGMPLLRTEFYNQNLHNFQFSLHYFDRCDRDWTIKFYTGLSTDRIIQIIEKDTFYNLGWFVNTAAKISQEKTSEIINAVSLDVLAHLAKQSTLGNLQRFLSHCIRFDVGEKNRLKQLVDMLIDDIPFLLESVTYDDIKKFRKEVYRLYDDDRAKIENLYDLTAFDEPDNAALILFRTSLSSSPYFFIKASKLTTNTVKIFLEKYFALKLSKSTPHEIVIFLSILKQKYSPYYRSVLERTLEYIFNGAYIYQFLSGDIDDLMAIAEIFELGSVEDKFNQEIAKRFVHQINSLDRSSELAKASPNFSISFIWNMVSIGDIKKIMFVDRSTLLMMINSVHEFQVTRSLELVGILSITDSSYCDEPVIRNLKLSEADSDQITVYMSHAITNNQRHVPCLLILKGLRCWNPDVAQEILLRLINISNVVAWVDELLGLANTNALFNLIQETRRWIGEILFQDTINSIDKLLATISSSQNG